MPAGIRILNDAGSVQIDENYKNLCLSAKGTTSTTARGGFYLSYVDLSITGTMPVLALRCATAVVMVASATHSGGVWTYRIFGGESVGADVIEYYVFDVPPATPSGEGGLIVRDAQGAITFDSGRKYLRVVDFFSYDWLTNGASRSYPAGRTYAFIFSRPAYGVQSTPAGLDPGLYNNYYGGTGFMNQGAALWYDWMNTSGRLRSNEAPQFTPLGRLTVIDVTNY